jgi:parvulin-like peptidyl-prolyl isomerase
LVRVSSSRADEEAKAISEDIYRKLQQNPESFEAIAKELSDDKGSGSKGGSLGYSTKDKFVKAFSKTAFAMSDPGEITKPVKTRFGYHIIRLDDIEQARTPAFNEIEATVTEKAMQEYTKTLQKMHLTHIQSEDRRDLNVEGIEKLRSKMLGAE